MEVLKNISALFLKKKEDKIIEDELKSSLNTSDNASGLLAQRVYDFNSSSGTKIQHFLDFTKYFRWQNELGDVVSKADPDFMWETHIPYNGL